MGGKLLAHENMQGPSHAHTILIALRYSFSASFIFKRENSILINCTVCAIMRIFGHGTGKVAYAFFLSFGWMDG
jgi:hypothetical protein